MRITEKQLEALVDFFYDVYLGDITEEWILRHTNIIFDDLTHTVTITIDNINEQEYGWLRG